MPTLYRYFGITILFYARDHLPIHVHGKYQDTEMKAEFEVIDGNVVSIRFADVVGKGPLPTAQYKRFKRLVESKSQEIVSKWMDYFVLNKEITTEVITSDKL